MFLFILFVIVVCVVSSIIKTTLADDPISEKEFWRDMDSADVRAYVQKKLHRKQ